MKEAAVTETSHPQQAEALGSTEATEVTQLGLRHESLLCSPETITALLIGYLSVLVARSRLTLCDPAGLLSPWDTPI